MLFHWTCLQPGSPFRLKYLLTEPREATSTRLQEYKIEYVETHKEQLRKIEHDKYRKTVTDTKIYFGKAVALFFFNQSWELSQGDKIIELW